MRAPWESGPCEDPLLLSGQHTVGPGRCLSVTRGTLRISPPSLSQLLRPGLCGLGEVGLVQEMRVLLAASNLLGQVVLRACAEETHGDGRWGRERLRA